MLSATETLSGSTVKSIFLKREERVRSSKIQQNYKLQVFILKLRVANYELNLELQFNKIFAKSNFQTATC